MRNMIAFSMAFLLFPLSIRADRQASPNFAATWVREDGKAEMVVHVSGDELSYEAKSTDADKGVPLASGSDAPISVRLDGKKRAETWRDGKKGTISAKVLDNGNIEIKQVVNLSPNYKITYVQTWALLENGNTLKISIVAISESSVSIQFNGKETDRKELKGKDVLSQVSFHRKN
jgi:hypothetical protein